MSMKEPKDLAERYLLKACTLDGIEYEWKMPSKVIQGNKRKTSTGHQKVRQILAELYPLFQVYEEVPIRVRFHPYKTLYLDLYVKHLNLAIEVHGAQHYEFSSLFHKTHLDFLIQQRNDSLKVDWCNHNDIDLLVLDSRNTLNWKEMIQGYEY